MPRRLIAQVAALLLALAFLSGPRPASAADLTNTFGIGGELGSDLLGGDSGIIESALSFKYWVSDFGFQALTSLTAKHIAADADAGTDASTPVTLQFAIRALYNVTRTESTHLFIGTGVSARVVFGGSGDKQAIDLLLGVEHFFTRYFSVSGQIGAHIGLAQDIDLVIGRVTAWGTGFHFYF
ncbi:MAG: hypothetical protein EP329_06645 [Deltaproteobacteria bacterium]|nr:MAG: hypothetical protein EP329_06645 [Deltaproteobacteria bacterium]